MNSLKINRNYFLAYCYETTVHLASVCQKSICQNGARWAYGVFRSREAGWRLRLVPFSTPWAPLTAHTRDELRASIRPECGRLGELRESFEGHDSTLKLRPNGGGYSKTLYWEVLGGLSIGDWCKFGPPNSILGAPLWGLLPNQQRLHFECIAYNPVPQIVGVLVSLIIVLLSYR